MRENSERKKRVQPHPVDVAGTPENRAYRAIWSDLQDRLGELDACGIALVVLIPVEGGIFSIASIGQRGPVTRHLLISECFAQVAKWHAKETEGKYTGWKGALLRWANRRINERKTR
jgi:hypothetical protein